MTPKKVNLQDLLAQPVISEAIALAVRHQRPIGWEQYAEFFGVNRPTGEVLIYTAVDIPPPKPKQSTHNWKQEGF